MIFIGVAYIQSVIENCWSRFRLRCHAAPAFSFDGGVWRSSSVRQHNNHARLAVILRLPFDRGLWYQFLLNLRCSCFSGLTIFVSRLSNSSRILSLTAYRNNLVQLLFSSCLSSIGCFFLTSQWLPKFLLVRRLNASFFVYRYVIRRSWIIRSFLLEAFSFA